MSNASTARRKDPEYGPGRESDRTPRLLVVEDDGPLRELLAELLAGEGFQVEAVADGQEGLRRLQEGLYDVVLLDLNLPGMHGLNVLAAAPATQTDARFIIMTAEEGAEPAVRALKSGADDYLRKPVDPDELLRVIERSLRARRIRRRAALGRSDDRTESGGLRREIVGDSPPLQRMMEMVERVAPTRSTVLLQGETGSGKELAARAIHDLSDRASRPFVPVTCSAIPESLLESELFGHMKGSFTGAIASRKGVFEEAHGGTLFLDEISTLSPSVQVKLLRVLEEREVQPVGGNRAVPVDFRLVAATNRDLQKEMQEGRFREDLFYRIHVFPLRVPPLRERVEDIPVLAEHFRERFAEMNGMEDPPEFPPETLERMMAYDWPGNVRELENFVERAMITYAGAEGVPFDAPGRAAGESGGEARLLEEARLEGWELARLEKEYLLSVLEMTGGNRTRAAEILGIDRRTVYRKLKQYEKESGDASDADGTEEVADSADGSGS